MICSDPVVLASCHYRFGSSSVNTNPVYTSANKLYLQPLSAEK